MELVPVSRDDVEEVHALVRRWETHWVVPYITPLSEVVHGYDAPGFDPALDSRGAWLDGRLVAHGVVVHRPSGVRLERAFVLGVVDPEVRGNGLGRRLLAWQIERAAEQLRQCDPALPRYIRVHEWDWITDAHHLYARQGMKQVRWFETLMRPLVDLPAVAAPAGTEIVAWDAVPGDDARRVSNDSFSDHWGSIPQDETAWNHMVSGEWVERDLSFAATAGGETIGVCLNTHFPDDFEVTDRHEGWIDHLGVLASWRGRGVASALIAASLHAFAAAGFTHALLAVDADNPSGASRLYRNLGFELLNRSITSEIEISSNERF